MEDQVLVPTGFRFYPTEEELISFYLRNKLNATRPDIDRLIPVLDIYDYNPSDLPRLGGEHSPIEDGEQWFFFIPRQEREARGGRPNRLTAWGYWKATGSPGDVYSSQNRVIGRKRTMVFYTGRAPNGRKTVWKMNEYKAINDEPSSSSTNTTHKLREEVSLCRIYKSSKSLRARAFDRRPSSSSEAVVPHRDHEAAATTSSDQQNPTDHEISSSSGILDMDIDNEPFWDLEQLKYWFDHV